MSLPRACRPCPSPPCTTLPYRALPYPSPLAGVLAGRFHGIALPLLPSKRVIGNKDEDFVEDRRRGLQDWLTEVGANPYLRLDTTMRMFLTTPHASEFDSAKKAVDASNMGGNTAENAGLSRWFGVLRALPQPKAPEAAITELEHTCKALSTSLGKTLSVVQAYHDAAIRMAEAAAAMRDVYRILESTEEDCAGQMGSFASLSAAAAGARASKDSMEHVGEAWASASRLTEFTPNEVSMFLGYALDAEARRVGGLQSLLDVYHSAVDAFTSAWRQQDNAGVAEQKARDKGDLAKIGAAEAKHQEARAMAQRLKSRVDDIVKGLLLVESARTMRARAANLRTAFGSYAALGIASGEQTQAMWTKLVNDLGLEAESMVAVAKGTLTGEPPAKDYGGMAGPVALPQDEIEVPAAVKRNEGSAEIAAGHEAAATAAEDDAVDV